MTSTRLLVGQILIVFAIMLLGVWAAPQWAAAMLGYQPRLGAPWFGLGGLPLYRPWALFSWWFHYDAYAPAIFNRAGALAGASGFLGCAAAVAGSLWRARQPGEVTTYGSARWAGRKEIRRSGLAGDAGVFLGTFGGAPAAISARDPSSVGRSFRQDADSECSLLAPVNLIDEIG